MKLKILEKDVNNIIDYASNEIYELTRELISMSEDVFSVIDEEFVRKLLNMLINRFTDNRDELYVYLNDKYEIIKDDNNDIDDTEQSLKITTKEELYSYLEDRCDISYGYMKDGELFIQTDNNTSISVDYDEDDSIGTIIMKTAERLDEFCAEDEFNNLWNSKFGEQNGFTAKGFIKMLEEDEKLFHSVAMELKVFLIRLMEIKI